MSRGYTREDFRAVVDSLRRHIPGISITTDIIVGFPGETRDQFEETLDLVREIRFDNAFMFAYSTRAGTAAAMMKEQLDEQEKLERLHELISTQNRITQEVNRSLEGSVREILIECTSRKNACVLTGRTRDNRVVNVSGGADLIGRLVPAVLTRAYTWGFQGELA
jgi:tRNA-2-methylthio-N6-dimethylallyladenosine synthase